MFTDNKDFYPTPEALFRRLMDGKRYISGRILEPSAGKGVLGVDLLENSERRAIG